MRALVIGRGSMGRRRIRDLTALGVEVASWDITDDAPLAVHPQLVLVCTPPGTHAQYVAPVDAPVLATFTEADIEAVDAPHFPSATPLFTDWWRDLSFECTKRVIHGYTLHVGQDIHDWHPGADPSTYYAYQQATGPTREMIPFELIWLTKVFGPVLNARGFRCPSVAQVAVEHLKGISGHIMIDALSRPPIRRFTAVALGWQHSWDLAYSEDTYLREMRSFVAAVKGEAPWPYCQADEAANLEVLHMIERSA